MCRRDNMEAMTRWSDEARQRLRDGERIETTVPFGDNAVVVTDQRVFAFTPEGEGTNYRVVERPNVEAVGLGMVGETGWLRYALKGSVVGAVGIGIGLTTEFGSLFTLGGVGSDGPVRIEFGGLLEGLQTVVDLLGYLDEGLLVLGGLGVAVALTTLGVFVQSRDHTLVVAVAGDEDIHVPAPRDSEDERDELRRVLGGVAPAETGDGERTPPADRAERRLDADRPDAAGDSGVSVSPGETEVGTDGAETNPGGEGPFDGKQDGTPE